MADRDDGQSRILRALVEGVVPTDMRGREEAVQQLLDRFVYPARPDNLRPRPTKPSPEARETPTGFVVEVGQVVLTAGHVLVRPRGAALSRKLSNVVLDWAAVLELICAGTLTLTGVVAEPRLLLLAALGIALALWREIGVEVSPRHALVLLAMWQHRDEHNRISEEYALEVAQKTADQEELPRLTRGEFQGIVDDLRRMRCVELVDGYVYMIETVVVRS